MKQGTMKPKPFQLIEKSNYLFRDKLKDLNSPEEEVRQWAVFELLSTYGIPIKNIDIEHNAGRKFSKFNPADIVVLRSQEDDESGEEVAKDKKPRPVEIVVECKKRKGMLNVKRGQKQAQDYAEYLKAKYAVLTNGDKWLVTRYWKGEWVSVNGIEKITETTISRNVLDVIVTLEDVVPLFYWLHETIPSSDAIQYFSTLQHLFVPRETNEFDHHLAFGTSALLAVLGTFHEIGKTTFKAQEYKLKKLKEAFFHLISYYTNKDIEDKTRFLDLYDFEDLIRNLLIDFSNLVENHSQMSLIDSSMIRLNYFLLKYLRDLHESSKYADIDVKTIGQEVEIILDYILLKELNRTLPSSFEDDDIKALKLYGKEPWEKTKLAVLKK